MFHEYKTSTHLHTKYLQPEDEKNHFFRVDKKGSGYTGPVQCSVLAAMKRDTGRPPIYKKAYDLYYSECHVLDRYEIKKEDAVLKQTHVHSTLLGLWLSRGL